eukprot:scaffold7980_cov71-Skeletonema_dohrnii-CCMP3373.AAC.3
MGQSDFSRYSTAESIWCPEPSQAYKTKIQGNFFLLFYRGINTGKEGTSVAADKSYANRLAPRGPISSGKVMR